MQLQEIDSRCLNVTPAKGGDPQFPFNVKFLGDEVLGNSGSFRHFLSSIVDQLHGPTLNLLIPYRGTGTSMFFSYLCVFRLFPNLKDLAKKVSKPWNIKAASITKSH